MKTLRASQRKTWKTPGKRTPAPPLCLYHCLKNCLELLGKKTVRIATISNATLVAPCHKDIGVLHSTGQGLEGLSGSLQ